MSDDTRRLRAQWDRVAEGWERYEAELAAFTAPVRDALIEELRLEEDDVVLELAAGTGGLGRAIAGEVREVRSIDLAPGMVAAARRRAADAGLANVRCEVADARDLPFDDATVDAVVCQMGLMLMPEPAAAVAEAHRVLRDDGRIAVATWGPPEHNLWVLLLGLALLQHGHPVPGDPMGPGGVCSLSTAEAVAQRLADAGFSDVRTRSVPVEESFGTIEHAWDRHAATAGPLRGVLEGLTQAERDAVRETYEASCEAMRDGRGYTFTGEALVASATA